MRDLLATLFETAGLLLLAAAAGFAVGSTVNFAAGLGVAGAALVVEGVVVAKLEPAQAGDEE